MSDRLRPLHPDQVKVLRVRAIVVALVLVAAAAAVDIMLIRATARPNGSAAAAAALLGLAAVLALPRRRYRTWGYRMDEDELRIGSGLLVRSDTIVPFGRVQHIDVVRGPVQRAYGLATLVLHTAGTRSAAVFLPGLEAEEAERMRDHIRGRIREEPA